MSQIGTNKDVPIKITIQDTSGAAVNITSFDEDIQVLIYQKRENIIQSFLQSEGQVATIVAAEGTVRVKLDRANTAKINTLNPLYIEVIPMSTDASYEDGIRKWDVPILKLPALIFSATA